MSVGALNPNMHLVECDHEEMDGSLRKTASQSTAVNTHWVHARCDVCGSLYMHPEQRLIFDETVPSTHNPLRRNIPPEYAQQVLLVEGVMRREILGRPVRKLWTLADFDIGRDLGSGSYGMVYRARELKTGYVCVLKTLNRRRFKCRDDPRKVLREIEIQSRLRHNNVLALYNYFVEGASIYLLVEHAMYGSLMKRVYQMKRNQQLIPPYEVATYTEQVASALEYCHAMKVWHRDIKPENILFNVNSVVKLADFGLSVRTSQEERHTRCGTKDYIAPEMVQARGHSQYVDNWALGVLVYELSTLEPPFYHPSEYATFRKIMECDVTYPEYLELGCVDLISRLLKIQPEARLSFREVREHPWIVGYTKLKKGLPHCA